MPTGLGLKLYCLGLALLARKPIVAILNPGSNRRSLLQARGLGADTTSGTSAAAIQGPRWCSYTVLAATGALVTPFTSSAHQSRLY